MWHLFGSLSTASNASPVRFGRRGDTDSSRGELGPRHLSILLRYYLAQSVGPSIMTGLTSRVCNIWGSRRQLFEEFLDQFVEAVRLIEKDAVRGVIDLFKARM